MNVNAYHAALSAVIPETDIASKNSLSYLAAATAMRLSGRPAIKFVDFDGKPHLECLGGSLVAVDVPVQGDGSVYMQRMWLPVMDRENQPLELKKTTATDINNNRQRCLVKAIAATLGHGMSVFLGDSGDGPKAAKRLKVQPDSDLATVEPLIATLREGGAPYIEWNVGLAAARITDAAFRWNVVLWDGLPFREVLGSLMVDVDTVYKGKEQRLSLPIMDAAFNPIPKDKANVSDWNKTVMRCLTKNIAFNSGYGLSVYAEDVKAEVGAEGTGSKKGAKANAKSTEAKATPAADAKAGNAPAATAEGTTKAAAAAETAQPAQPEVKETTAVANAESNAAAPADAAPATDAAQAAEAPAAIQVQPEAAPETTAQAAAPAPEASAPAAAAPAESAPADNAGTAVSEEDAAVIAEAVGRFQGVMAKRAEAGVPGLLVLFDQLHTSEKFAEVSKPACFGMLVTAVAAKVKEDNIVALIAAIEKYKVMPFVAQDARDLVASKVTAEALAEASKVDDDTLLAVPAKLKAAGVVKSVDDTFRLAKMGGTAQETLTLLRELVTIAESFDETPA
ncbi:DUF1071 domain-containing protein [Paraburkholderia sp. EG287A]|uniref:Sak single strand annealing protein n=1 Tax=Paraburkholderia sp. EG287A TaxID=3237012 RepID=UPI0034D265F8